MRAADVMTPDPVAFPRTLRSPAPSGCRRRWSLRRRGGSGDDERQDGRASSLNRSDEAASAHSITSSARPRDQMPNVAWFPIPLLAAHGRDIQALTKARRLSSGTFCSLACLRQADRFCRSAASFWRIALRVAASAVVRSGLMPVTGAVVLVAEP